MADLLDIAPSTACEVVKFDGNRVVVRGLNAAAIAAIAMRYPEVVGLLLGAGANFGPRLISQLGGAIPPIIAAGCGKLGDAESEQRASQFVFEYQMDIVMAIIGLTCPNGLASFAEKLAAFINRTVGEGATAKPVKVRLRNSRSRSQASSDPGSHLNMQ